MKSRLIAALTGFLLVCMIVSPAFADTDSYVNSKEYNTALVVDNANLLTDEEEADLGTYLNTISQQQNMDVVVLTENSIGGYTPEEYADDYYDYNGYGQGEDYSGCLLLLSMEERDWHISTSGFGITAITDYGIYVIEEEAIPYFSIGDYYTGFFEFASLVNDFATEAYNGTPIDIDNEYIGSDGEPITYGYSSPSLSNEITVSLICAIIIIVVIASMIKKSYKPVAFQRTANCYLVDNSLNVTASNETYLYTHTSKVRIEKNSGSSGGSSTHSSSSGRSHGGGGGKF